MRCPEMNNDTREINCEEIAEIEKDFPEEISVVREMLAEIGWQCPEEQVA
jgi:hypothetical protein